MGFGLALRLSRAGHEIIIGSRSMEKAREAAVKAKELAGDCKITGMNNEDAANDAELVIISVPSAGHRETVELIKDYVKDKLVLDITVPLAFKPLRYDPPGEGSNALETKAILGEGSRVVSGIHTVSAVILYDLKTKLDAEAFCVGNDTDDVNIIIDLLGEIGLKVYNAGMLSFSPTIESMTPMLIGMNKRYGSNQIGFKLTGIKSQD